MSLATNDTLYICIKRWRIFFRVFGLAPFSFYGCPHRVRLVCRPRDRIWPSLWLVSILTYLGLIIWQWTHIIPTHGEKEIFLYSFYKTLWYATVIMSFIPPLLSISPSITRFLTEIIVVDKSFNSCGDCRKLLPYVLSFIAVEVILIICILTVEIHFLKPGTTSWPDYSLIFGQAILYLLIALNYSQFNLMTLLLKQRYETINNLLSEFIENKLYILNPSDFRIQTQKMRHAYARLYEASRILGYYYGPSVVVGCFWCIGSVVACVSPAIRSGYLTYGLATDIAWAFVVVTVLIVTCGICETAIRLSLKTQVLIQKLLINKMESETEDELHKFYGEAKIMRAKFTVLEVEISMSLVKFVTAVATSYTLVFARIR